MLDYSSTDYLPDSYQRVEYLKEIVNNRSVAILVAGPSLSHLEKEISKLRDVDICFFGLNTFSVHEKYILKKIGKRFSVVMCSAREGIADEMTSISDFLDRKENNLFISSFWRDTFGLMPKNFSLNEFLDEYNNKLLFFGLDNGRSVPNFHQPLHFIVGNSLTVLIQLAIIGKASKVFVFGADGYCSGNKKQQYYHPDEYKISPVNNLIRDTNKYFNPILPVALRNLYRTYQQTPVEVLNCSIGSKYTPMPTITYKDAVEILRSKKNYKARMDHRIPKVTIILSEANESVSEAIRVAKGEYIFICPQGTGFIDPNWIEMCVEILENDPSLSLVWALKQQKLSDGAPGKVDASELFTQTPLQGKDFIYSWLEKPVVFCGPNFCVRKNALRRCLPKTKNFWTGFSYMFMTKGYLAHFVPVVVSYYHLEFDYFSKKEWTNYYQRVQTFRKKLLLTPKKISYFSYKLFIWYSVQRWLK